MSAERLELDELVEHWTLLDGERELVAGKRGTTRLVFALMLKFYGRHGRFPDGDGDLPREVVEFVARQVGVAPADLRRYEFSGRTVEYHRAQIREHFGFRECTVEDAQALERWLAEHVAGRIPAWRLYVRSCWPLPASGGSSRHRRGGSIGSRAPRSTPPSGR